MIGIRFTPAEKHEIEQMCEDAGIPPATLAKKCLLSALAYYRENGDVPMPPAIVRARESRFLNAPHGLAKKLLEMNHDFVEKFANDPDCMRDIEKIIKMRSEAFDNRADKTA
jgi:hypothetical protein